MNLALAELPVRLENLEISGQTPGYGWAPLQEKLARHAKVPKECVVAAIGTSIRRHDGKKFNRHGKDKAVVVIRMFADHVHAAGRRHDPARCAPVLFLKSSGDVSGEFFECHILLKRG